MSEVAGVGAGKFVRLAPLIAGKAPVNLDADIVPEPILLAFKFVKVSPDPLNLVADKTSVEELKVKVELDFGARSPVAAVVNRTLHEVSLDSAATVI